MTHASPERKSETLQLNPFAVCQDCKSVVKHPKNQLPATHPPTSRSAKWSATRGFTPKIVYPLLLAHTASTRYRMLLLLMLSKAQLVLTAWWLPAWLGRLTDVFMVTTEGRWPAMLQQQHLTVERDVTLQTLEKWNVSLIQRIETPHLSALLGTQSAQPVLHTVISRLLTMATELQVIFNALFLGLYPRIRGETKLQEFFYDVTRYRIVNRSYRRFGRP